MEIIKNTPPPVTPPATYDIKGMTHEELVLLRDIMGKFEAHGPAHAIYESLYVALGSYHSNPVKYRLIDGVHREVYTLSALSDL